MDRKRSDTHPGVSIQSDGTKHRLKWRVKVDGKWKSRSWRMAGTKGDAAKHAIACSKSLLAQGAWTPPETNGREVQPELSSVADLRELFLRWAEWRRTHKSTRTSTLKTIKGAFDRFEAEARVLERLPAEGPIPVTALTTTNCDRVVSAIEQPRTTKHGKVIQPGKHRTNQIMRYVFAAWEWASDEPEQWPGLAPAPRTKSRIVPSVPTPKRPSPAPSIEAMNGIVWIARNKTRSPDVGDILGLMRLTGLRQKQVRRLRVGDLELDTPVPSLRVRPDLGKSKHEAMGRTVPISPHAAELLRRLCVGKDARDEVFGRKSPISTHTLRKIMHRAEEIGGLDPRCWRDEERGNQRNSHLMRAGFLAALADAGVPKSVRGALVGHKPNSTEAMHYVPPTWEAMVEAVRKVPGLDWTPPSGEGSNVVELATRR